MELVWVLKLGLSFFLNFKRVYLVMIFIYSFFVFDISDYWNLGFFVFLKVVIERVFVESILLF